MSQSAAKAKDTMPTLGRSFNRVVEGARCQPARDSAGRILPGTDPRVQETARAIERNLMEDGFVYRYAHRAGLMDCPSGEGAFLPCTFWLADNFALMGPDGRGQATV